MSGCGNAAWSPWRPASTNGASSISSIRATRGRCSRSSTRCAACAIRSTRARSSTATRPSAMSPTSPARNLSPAAISSDDPLRGALARFDQAGELLRIDGADWKLEMGTLAEIVYREASPPAILFDNIPGYPKGFRALSGATNSAKRLAIVLGFPEPSHPLDVVRAYRDRMKTHQPIPPRVVKDGPVLENVVESSIDVLKFPAPLLHEHDGGRYLGTDDLVIMRDPEQGWVNCGTYRAMVQGP